MHDKGRGFDRFKEGHVPALGYHGLPVKIQEYKGRRLNEQRNMQMIFPCFTPERPAILKLLVQ